MTEPVIRPFTITTPQDTLDDLRQRLSQTRWPDPETPDDWQQGIPLAYMRDLVEHWLSDYDWQERVSRLNQHPGFMTELDGLDIHFLHIRSTVESAKPLLLTHGWPGSIVEFLKVIGPLTDPLAHGGDKSDAFHLVLPSLPGFGYSGKPDQTGWNIDRIATAWNSLMTRLGYSRYLAQGGDWGSIVTAAIGAQNLGQCFGIHMNMPVVAPDPETLSDPSLLEQESLRAAKFYQDHDSGYSKQQSTRPQTLGYGLADSPAGQAAWIIEKFYQWMDCSGDPTNVVSRDELLDNVMMYWLTNTAASSARIYWENARASGVSRGPVTIPSGCTIFPGEIFKTSERWAAKRFTSLVHFEVMERGGHFAAFEQPALFVAQLRKCFRKMPMS